MKRILFLLIIAAATLGGCSKDSTNSAAPGSGSGTGGSLARFTVLNDYLYVADVASLNTYYIGGGTGSPVFKSKVNLTEGVETIYAYEDKLFLGSQDAMYIFSLSNPERPVRTATASHVRACDPVVVKNQVAYVTVRSGSNCGGTVNALMVYGVVDIYQPELFKTINMESPIGLGYRGERLYVCNGSNGMDVYNIAIGTDPQRIKRITGENMKDVIVKDDLLIVFLEKGFAIYKLGANDDITQIAKMQS